MIFASSERGASPVVGIVLLVAITVILSTVAIVGVSPLFQQSQEASVGVSADYKSESKIVATQ